MADEENSVPSPSPPRDMLGTGLLGVAMLAAVGGLGMIVSVVMQSGPPDKLEVLRVATQQFIEDETLVASKLAATVELDPENEVEAEWVPTREFLVGIGEVFRARQEPDKQARLMGLNEGIPHLQAAADLGFPLGRQAQGFRMLGEAQHETGAFAEAANALKNAIDNDSLLYRQLMPLVADSVLKAPGTRAEEALGLIDTYLNDPTLDIRLRRQGDLVRIRALTALNDWDRSQQEIDAVRGRRDPKEILPDEEQIPLTEFLNQVELLSAQRALAKIEFEHGIPLPVNSKQRDAIAIALQPAVDRLDGMRRSSNPAIGTQASLWMAKLMLAQGQTEQSIIQLTSVRQQRPLGPAGIAAGIAEAELLSKQGRGIETLQTLGYLIREIGNPKGYDPTAFSLSVFKERLSGVIENLRTAGEYQSAIDLSRLLPPIFEQAEAKLQEGICYQAWAKETLRGGIGPDGTPSRSASEIARAKYRSAGEAYAESAKLDFDTERYLSTLWSAIDAYMEGRNHQKCIELLDPYLRYETRIRRPRGLIAYGQVLLAEGRNDDAIEALTECIVEHERDPLCSDARLFAAMAEKEKGDFDAAKQLLDSNLYDGELAPDSDVFRDSLFMLCESLFQQAFQNSIEIEDAPAQEKPEKLADNQVLLEETIRVLEKAGEHYAKPRVQGDNGESRHADVPRVNYAAYLKARAHVMAAQWPRMESQLPDRLDSARRKLRATADSELKTALGIFKKLSSELIAIENDHTLTPQDASLMRNCLMMEGDTLMEMASNETGAVAKQLIEEADGVYLAMSGRFMNEPLALEAIMARSDCLNKLGKTKDAEMQIKFASYVLGSIPPELDNEFEKTTRTDREGWEKLLTWVSGRANNQVGA